MQDQRENPKTKILKTVTKEVLELAKKIGEDEDYLHDLHGRNVYGDGIYNTHLKFAWFYILDTPRNRMILKNCGLNITNQRY